MSTLRTTTGDRLYTRFPALFVLSGVFGGALRLAALGLFGWWLLRFLGGGVLDRVFPRSTSSIMMAANAPPVSDIGEVPRGSPDCTWGL